jgi:hypothetical protein
VADGGIGFDDLDSLLFNDEIANNGSGQYGIAPNSVDSGEITDSTITSADLGVNSVAYSEVASSTFNSEITPSGAGNYGIADNSIQSSEVTDDSLTGSDINESTLAPSIHAYHQGRSDDLNVGVSIAGHTEPLASTIATVNVPAGSYVVLAELDVLNPDDNGTAVGCDISDGSTVIERDGLTSLEQSEEKHMALTAVATPAANTSITLNCYTANSSKNVIGRAVSADLTAIPVRAVN